MALWQLRLGENKQEYHDWRETHLAPEHSLVTIDYGIKKDIRNMPTRLEIRNHIWEVAIKIDPEVSEETIEARTRQTWDFKNNIEIGEYFISPINYLETNWDLTPINNKGDAGNCRIGRIVSDMEPLKSLFKGDLPDYLAKNAFSTWKGEHLTIDDCRNIPARRVEWLSDLFSAAGLPDKITKQQHVNDGKGTVAELNFSGELPCGLAAKVVFKNGVCP